MGIVWAVLLLCLLALLWATHFLGLPGNWLVLAATVLYVWLVPVDGRVAIEWGTVSILTVLAIVGEALELLASVLGVKRYGGSRRGAVLAFFGSLLGAVAGVVIGLPLPIPVVGSLVGALVFAGLGAAGGAFVGEHWKGRSLDHSLQVGTAAFFGRLLGTAGKMAVGAVMIGVVLAALLIA